LDCFRVSTRFESLADNATISKDPDYLTECARSALGRVITQKHLSPDGKLYVVTLDPQIEKRLADSVQKATQGGFLALDAPTAQGLVRKIKAEFDRAASSGRPVVLLTNSQIRLYLRRMLERALSGVIVLSYNELAGDVQVINFGQVRLQSEGQEVHS
jgi:flagellar biosynthesis protein FlhA